eukprot:SAG31_NODE_3684_length_3989_cov_2.709512_1_plen_337_part_00
MHSLTLGCLLVCSTSAQIGVQVMLHRKHAGPKLAAPIISLFGGDSEAAAGVLARSTTAALEGTSEAEFRRVIFLSQLAQTLCIKSYLEELRRGQHTMGALIWQLNDVWQASSWGSLDYGGRWRSLHHNLQTIFAPTLVSVWVDNSTAALHIYISHQGAPPAHESQVEVNVTTVATGEVVSSKLVAGIKVNDSSVAIRPLLSLPLSGIQRSTQFVTTRLVQTGDLEGIPSTAVVHPLMPPAEISWVVVQSKDVSLQVQSVSLQDWATVVTVTNTAAVPLFYVVLTSSCEGRFDDNLLYVPPLSTRTVRFAFADIAAVSQTDDEFEASLHMEWLNRAL